MNCCHAWAWACLQNSSNAKDIQVSIQRVQHCLSREIIINHKAFQLHKSAKFQETEAVNESRVQNNLRYKRKIDQTIEILEKEHITQSVIPH